MDPDPVVEPLDGPARPGLFTLADLRRAAIRAIFVGLGAAVPMAVMLAWIMFSPGGTLGLAALVIAGTGATCGLGSIPPSLVELAAARRPPSTRTTIGATALALGAAAAGFLVAGVQLIFAVGFLLGRSLGESIDQVAFTASFGGGLMIALYAAQFAIPCALVAGGRVQGGPLGRPTLQAMLWNLIGAVVLAVPMLVLRVADGGSSLLRPEASVLCCGIPLMAVPGCGIAVCYAIADAIDARIARRGEGM